MSGNVYLDKWEENLFEMFGYPMKHIFILMILWLNKIAVIGLKDIFPNFTNDCYTATVSCAISYYYGSYFYENEDGQKL